jgi:hypothetical protein
MIGDRSFPQQSIFPETHKTRGGALRAIGVNLTVGIPCFFYGQQSLGDRYGVTRLSYFPQARPFSVRLVSGYKT